MGVKDLNVYSIDGCQFVFIVLMGVKNLNVYSIDGCKK